MNPKLNAGLAKRLTKVWDKAFFQTASRDANVAAKHGWQAVAKEMRHLHPGNEVARALNLIIRKPNCASVAWVNHVLEKLNGAGIRVRWDAKKGRFV